ncbi:MAG: acetyltransferase [gamma proteobacterium endosymbiont of Lamellibrachia anaximandri]|nr:acetyltransferase [gamma proteobacterium endosymbiont of Lamellibrachia anaximandri]MBL3617999.1 acetyltransferase [gamma proteobacterium endosymbiont of Lamellibrachia anaximandri]
MFVMQKNTKKMVEVLSLSDLFDPMHGEVVGRFHAGEEMQDPEKFTKDDLLFPSGEVLPRCWVDSHYREG